MVLVHYMCLYKCNSTHYISFYPSKYIVTYLQNDVTSEVTQNHQFPLFSLCCGLGDCNITVLICSLVEHTIMVHIDSWQITVQWQIIDLIIYITLKSVWMYGCFCFWVVSLLRFKVYGFLLSILEAPFSQKLSISAWCHLWGVFCISVKIQT